MDNLPASAPQATPTTGFPNQSDPADAEAGDYWHALIDENEAAAFLDVSTRTLQGWRYKGGGPRYFCLSARLVKYTRLHLREHREQFARTSTSDGGASNAA